MNDRIAVQQIFEDICWYYKWMLPERELTAKTEAQKEVTRVCSLYGWSELSEADYKAHKKVDKEGIEISEDSKIRNLRKKYTFLMKNVLHRNKKKFKNGEFDEIPSCDAPIVATLLMHAVSVKKTKYNPIRKWFNGRIQNSDYGSIIELFKIIQEILTELLEKGIIDHTTYNNWLSTISNALEYDIALNITRLADTLRMIERNFYVLSSEADETNETEYNKLIRLRSMIKENRNIDALLEKSSKPQEYVEVIDAILHYVYYPLLQTYLKYDIIK